MKIQLFAAIKTHNISELKKLLKVGADPNVKDEAGFTALEIAVDETCDGGPIDAVKLLLDHGAVTTADASRPPILLLAWRPTNKALAKILLDAGAEANVRTDEGESPLRDCVADGDLAMVMLLLKRGARKSIDDWGGLSHKGLTALGIAARQLNIAMIKLLLENGANRAATDDDYKTAREQLPPREGSDQRLWEEALALLS